MQRREGQTHEEIHQKPRWCRHEGGCCLETVSRWVSHDGPCCGLPFQRCLSREQPWTTRRLPSGQVADLHTAQYKAWGFPRLTVLNTCFIFRPCSPGRALGLNSVWNPFLNFGTARVARDIYSLLVEGENGVKLPATTQRGALPGFHLLCSRLLRAAPTYPAESSQPALTACSQSLFPIVLCLL